LPNTTRALRCLLAGLALILASCHQRGDGGPVLPSVTVAHPRSQPVTEFLDLTGSVAASRSVDLVARISGYLQSVNFADGAYVEAGQLLFVIEPEPYKQQLASNQAALLQAQSEFDRQQQLISQDATSTANLEKWRSTRDQAQAQMELSKINLGYTRVTAPFAGRIGRRQVDPGNLVGAGGATKLATLDQLRPIYVNFSMNERTALYLRAMLRQMGLEPKAAVGQAQVLVGLSDEKDYPHVGVLDFADNEISSSTGTIAMRAIFKNDDRTMFPGLFARVRIPLGAPKPMLVIPNSAIGNDQQGDYVFVLDAHDVVARRAIVKGPVTPEGCAIRSGLADSDRVVINGILNARPGEKVAPQQGALPAAATTS